MTPAPPQREAILFRTHFWDEFAQRQFDRLLSRAAGCDVFVLVDETGGPVDVPHDKVVRVTAQGLLAMGFADAGEGNLLWFNGDYPLYRFTELHPQYERILQLEYDVAINIDIAPLMARLQADGIDFVGLTKGEPALQWPWLHTCLDVYAVGDLRHQLICVSAFSARALRHLWSRRLVHARLLQEGAIAAWPMCEAFIATELAAGGFRVAELSAYGDTCAYDHWPPYLEADADRLSARSFVHPLLDEKRFIASMLKYRVGVEGYIRPHSLFHRKLRRLPPGVYLRAVAVSFAAKARRVAGEAVRTLRSRRSHA